jgi:hypothetical protein
MLNSIIPGSMLVQPAWDVLKYARNRQEAFACGCPAGLSAAVGCGSRRALIASARIEINKKRA